MAAFPFESPPPYSLPVGYGFRPTEEELITHYLHNKMLGNESLVQSIPEVDLYNYEPHQLPELSTCKSDNHEWFFFQPDSNTETKRTTSTGYWKSTGKERKIMARGTKDVIETKRILVFHQGKTPNGVRTRWILHEYRLQIQHTDYKRSFIVCRLKEKAQYVSTCGQYDSSRLKRKATERVTHLKPNQQLEHQSLNQVHSETQPAIGASVFEPDTDSSYSEPQLSLINFQSSNAYANGETPLKVLDRFLLSPCTMPESSFFSDDLTRWQNELQNLVQGPTYNSVDQVIFQSRSTKTFKASKSKDLESYESAGITYVRLQGKESFSDDGPTTRESLRQPKSRDLISFGSKQRKIRLLSKVFVNFKVKGWIKMLLTSRQKKIVMRRKLRQTINVDVFTAKEGTDQLNH